MKVRILGNRILILLLIVSMILGDTSVTAEKDRSLSSSTSTIIVGRVLSAEGNPIAWNQVTAVEEKGCGCAFTTTDSEGNFTLDVYRGGNFTVKSESGYLYDIEKISLEAGETVYVELVLSQFGGTITGKITDINSGDGVYDAFVHIRDANGNLIDYTTTDLTGTYDSTLPAGNYTLDVRVGSEIIRIEQPIQVLPAQMTTLPNIPVVVTRIIGVVLDQYGKPVKWASITVKNRIGFFGRYSNEKGMFSLNVSDGLNRLTVSNGNYTVNKLIEINRGETVRQKIILMHVIQPLNKNGKR